jgi:hypothetical protein
MRRNELNPALNPALNRCGVVRVEITEDVAGCPSIKLEFSARHP